MTNQPLGKTVKLILALNALGFLLLVAGVAFVFWKIAR